MAERFGGKFSPDGSINSDHGVAPEGPAVSRKSSFGGRNLLYVITPVPFAIRAFAADPSGLVLGLAAAAVMALGVWLTLEGVRAEQAYHDRRVARRPAIPRKLFGSILTGVALYLGGRLAGTDTIQSLGLLLIGAGLHVAAFGPDPLRNKGMTGIDAFQTDRVARAVDEAEAYLAAMKDAILRVNDRSLGARVDKFAKAARVLFRDVESDPGDLTAARKFLTVYLMGARDATIKFADIYARDRDAQARADYEALLTDLESQFAVRTKALLADNHADLNVEITVLRERLQREN